MYPFNCVICSYITLNKLYIYFPDFFVSLSFAESATQIVQSLWSCTKESPSKPIYGGFGDLFSQIFAFAYFSLQVT